MVRNDGRDHFALLEVLRRVVNVGMTLFDVFSKQRIKEEFW